MAYEIPDDLAYLPTHQWLRVSGGTGEVGITDYAQKALGGVTWVELPAVGDRLTLGAPLGSVESVKAVSDVQSPVTGEVIAVNEQLEDNPELCNQDPYHKGWLVRVKIAEKSPELLAPQAYAKLLD